MGLNKFGRLPKKAPKPFTEGMFNLPSSVSDLPADGVGFEVADGFAAGKAGIKRVTSGKTTFSSLGKKEGKRLAGQGRKSVTRKTGSALRKLN